MSLAPGEQRALAGIEESLHRADPGLAAMMETFTVLASRGRAQRWKWLSLWRLRTRRRTPLARYVPVALRVVVAVLVLAMGVLLGHARQSPGRAAPCSIVADRVDCHPADGPPRRVAHPSGVSAGRGAATAASSR